uniref:G-protein coupled receptors family 1 profile domain-containing protein n=1 Tax=Pygocentrus nattereri TaxID=42514 RepID=A0A3B4DLS8_PYGNA
MDETDCMHNITVQYCFPYMNSSCRKEVQTGPAYIFLFIQLHTPTNLLILSLAVADLLVGLIVMPVNVIGFIDSCWYFGKMGCIIFPLITFISMSASLCSLIFIAVDQYIAVCDPLLYSTRVTVCRTSLLIILGWSLCLLYVTMYLYFNDHFLQSQISTRCDGECILVQKYSWVIIDLVFSFLTPSQSSNVSETKAAKTLSITIFVYLASYIPFCIGSLTDNNLTSSSMVWTVFSWLIYMTSSFNPLIYAIFYPWFRASVKYVLTCKIFVYPSSRLNLFPKHV